MHDPMTDRLSAYIDGDLTPEECAAVDAHLATCDACRETLDELRDVVAAAATLRPTGPERDLWPAIADGIGGGAAGRAPRLLDGWPRRRFHLSMPQLAAAAVVLMTVSGGVVWLIDGARRGGATPAGSRWERSSTRPVPPRPRSPTRYW
jgi:anti-sigma factor RsiW